jgi:CopG antitoxin of type II toxin-antitoxin system
MKAKKFDEKFAAGEDITGALDLSKARRVGFDARRVNVDFPSWMVQSIDQEATRLGVTRQSLIKLWLAERLEKQKAAADR